MTSLLDPTRPDVLAPMFSTWRVGPRAQETLDAIATAWRRTRAPEAGTAYGPPLHLHP